MSDILIKGMELPKGNDYLHLIIQNGKVHTAISCGHLTTDELNVAEAVELPPHGRLIDIDRFIKEERDYYCSNCEKSICKTCWVFLMIDETDEAPTVLEANYQQITSKQ